MQDPNKLKEEILAEVIKRLKEMDKGHAISQKDIERELKEKLSLDIPA